MFHTEQLIPYAAPAAIAMGGIVAAIGLRVAFACAALNQAVSAAQPMLQRFKTEIAERKTDLPPQAIENGKALHKMIVVSEGQRQEHIKRAAALVVKPAQAEKESPDLRIAALSLSVAAIAASVVKYKMIGLLHGEATYQVTKRAGLEVEAPKIGVVDQHIVDIMTEAGIVDMAIEMRDLFADMTSDTAADIAEILLDPLALKSFKTAKQEIDLLLSGHTTFADTLVYGVAPVIGKIAAMKIGAAAGAKAGAVVAGAPTAGAGAPAGAFFGALIGAGLALLGSNAVKHEWIASAIKEDQGSLKTYVNVIDTEKGAAQARINGKIDEQFSGYPALVESCPRLLDRPEAQQALAKIRIGHVSDLRAEDHRIQRALQAVLQKIPAKDWRDILLGIDRHATVTNLFDQAAGERSVALRRRMQDFHRSATPLNLLADPVAVPAAANGGLAGALKEIRPHLQAAANDHDRLVESWGQQCTKKWEEGSAAVSACSLHETEQLKGVVAKLSPVMTGLQQRIQTNIRRLG